MEIRKIKETEMNDALELVWQTFLEYEAPDYTNEGILEFEKSIKDKEWQSKREFYGAFEENKILGVIATKDKNHISLFFVDGKHHKQGIGKKLFNKISELNKTNYFTVNSSPYAKEVYIHLGFECTDKLQEVNGLKFYPMKNNNIKNNNINNSNSQNDAKIYIVQMHTNTMPSKLVKLATGYQYSHVAISFDKSCDTLYSFGRRRVNSILDGGFTVTKKNGEFFEKFNETICRIYELKVTKEQLEKLKMIIADMEKNQEQYKYDFIGAGLRFFKIPVSFKNKFVCSYFVADVLEKSNIYKFDKKAIFIKPKDFENIKGITEIYSGKYNIYVEQSY